MRLPRRRRRSARGGGGYASSREPSLQRALDRDVLARPREPRDGEPVVPLGELGVAGAGEADELPAALDAHDLPRRVDPVVRAFELELRVADGALRELER